MYSFYHLREVDPVVLDKTINHEERRTDILLVDFILSPILLIDCVIELTTAEVLILKLTVPGLDIRRYEKAITRLRPRIERYKLFNSKSYSDYQYSIIKEYYPEIAKVIEKNV